jgi:hypothetical protein
MVMKVKQEIIICQVCEEVIETADGHEGVKTRYGICPNCSHGKKEQ